MEISKNNRRAGRPSKSKSGASSRMNKTLSKAMLILERLAQSGNGLTLSELSMQLGFSLATIHRLLYTFERLGYVYQNQELGLWFIGVRSFEVGIAFLNRRDLVTISRPIMFELMETSGETVNLSIVDEGEIVYISQIESYEMMRMIVKLGGRAPIHASGAGKAMLSTFSKRHTQQILKKKGLKKITANTISSTAQLESEIQKSRQRGYAADDEEHAIGLRCLAAPIYDEQAAACAAISISGPKVRISDLRMAELGIAVMKAANRITNSLGGLKPQA